MNIGSLRRIDNLGRIVLPKSIRKKIKIKSGDSLEIYIKGETIIIKKHSEFGKMESIIKTITDHLSKVLKSQVYIIDKCMIICSSKEIKDRELKDELNTRQLEKKDHIELNEQIKLEGEIITNPILVNGDIYGYIVVSSKDKFKSEDIFLLKNLTTLISNLLEE